MGKVKKIHEVVRKSCASCEFRYRDYEKKADFCTNPMAGVSMKKIVAGKMLPNCPFKKQGG